VSIASCVVILQHHFGTRSALTHFKIPVHFAPEQIPFLPVSSPCFQHTQAQP